MVLRVNGHFRRRFWLYDKSFAMIGHRRADSDSDLGRRGRLMAGLKVTRQRNLVAPIAVFWLYDRSFATVGCRRADLDNYLERRGRLMVWLKATRQ
ncbi:hypothetical protein ACFX11_032378 [Malus domestica]